MFLKECKAISKSIIYFAFVFVVVLFYTTQFGNYAGDDITQYTTREVESGRSLYGNPLIEPVPGQDDYGYRNEEIPEQVMPNAIVRLADEYTKNGFTSYSTGFYRSKKLSEEQLAEVHDMIIQMTGLSADELLILRNQKIMASGNTPFVNQSDFSDVIPIIVSYDEFKENMEKIDKMIGGSLYFGASTLKLYGQAAVTYEERLAEYNDFLNIDKITGAYARLFCDYMGIVVALFSVFVPVSFLLRDKRAKMNELIYSREKSSASIVLKRYFALEFMMLLPFLLLSLIPTLQLSIFAANNNLNVDYLAFIKYIITWLLPTILTTTAVAFLFTTLTDTPIAILFQLIWSLFGLFASANNIEGGQYGIEINIRHNSIGNLHLFQENINALIINRLSYTAISIFLAFAAVFFYNLKRRGRLNVFNDFKKAFWNR